MKWKKLGKIFDPRDHRLPNGCIEFAQSPQTLLINDFVRIFFSTREKDNIGKYLSHIAFADFSRDFEKIIGVSEKQVIKLGNLGCYDEHGIFPMNVFRDKERILGYIGGWSRRIAVSVETSIGLAYSINDGLTFERLGNGPILTSSLNEPFLVGDPFVTIYNSTYHMWYIYGTRWLIHPSETNPQRVYKIGHAVSRDGILWKKEGRQIISDRLNTEECQALPTVIYHQGKYHMFFCYREAIGFKEHKHCGYRIGYAYSVDQESWVRDDAKAGIDVSEDGWDSDMQCYPHIFQWNDKIYLLYNGNEFGRYGFGAAVLEEI